MLKEGARPLAEARATEFERAFFRANSQTPDLRPGIPEGLDALRDQGCLVLVLTEGGIRRVRDTAEELGLQRISTGIGR